MSNELTRLEQQVRLAMEGEAWHGPAVETLLDGAVCLFERFARVEGVALPGRPGADLAATGP